MPHILPPHPPATRSVASLLLTRRLIVCVCVCQFWVVDSYLMAQDEAAGGGSSKGDGLASITAALGLGGKAAKGAQSLTSNFFGSQVCAEACVRWCSRALLQAHSLDPGTGSTGPPARPNGRRCRLRRSHT